jgi:uncharacterized membrane protein YphA (DoxX/SURF4 family)
MYGFYAPAVLRIAAACVLFYLAYVHYKNAAQIGETQFPVFGKGMWIPWVAIVVEFVVGAGLFLGYHTQVAAILGALISLKHFVWRGNYKNFFILSRTTTFLLFVICLSLILTGAGALAFDLPL